MSERNYLAVLMPLDETARRMAEQKETRQAVRTMVWSRTAALLQGLLGKTCTQFMPALRPWNEPVILPYGVALGPVDAHAFILCYAAAHKAQETELERRSKAIRARGKPVFSAKLSEDVTVTAMAYDRNDQEMPHLMELADRFFKGDITGSAGIYYLEQRSNFVDPEFDRKLLTNVRDYALCVAELTPVEV